VEQTTLNVATTRKSKVSLPTDQLLCMTAIAGSSNRSSLLIHQNDDQNSKDELFSIANVQEDLKQKSSKSKSISLHPPASVVSGAVANTIPVPIKRASTVGAHPIAGIMDADDVVETQGRRDDSEGYTNSFNDNNSEDAIEEEEEEETVTAIAITRDDLEEEVRQRLVSEAVTAEVVAIASERPEPNDEMESSSSPSSPPKSSHSIRNKWIYLALGLLLVLIGVAVGVIVAVTSKDHENNEEGDGENTIETDLLQFLRQRSPKVREESSPQNQAYWWLYKNGYKKEDDALWETYALCIFYLSTGGDEWANSGNWLDDNVSVCDWYPGNICDPPKNRRRVLQDGNSIQIRKLILNKNNLAGTLPSELEFLTDLQVLHLGLNQLEGTLPSVLGTLSNLQEFDIQNQGFSGPIPPEYGNLESLRLFDVRDNGLTGKIPSEFGALSNLKRFVARKNDLSSSLPPELSNLAQLTEFEVDGNKLTGTVPKSYSNWTSIGKKKRH
jgi:hypothetical protein